jgi:hypothetical protein
MTSWWTEASASRVNGNIGRTAGAEAIANRKRCAGMPIADTATCHFRANVWSRAISYAQRAVAQGDIQQNRDADHPPVIRLRKLARFAINI